MNNREIMAGLDVGHVNTKSIIIRSEEILGFATVPSGLKAVSSAQEALKKALQASGVLSSELKMIGVTGFFRNMIQKQLNIKIAVPEEVAEAKGAVFLNRNSRTLISLGGNIQKALRYDQDGNLIDIIQNDKCADGLGIFYTSMAKAFGIDEHELSELALKSTKHLSVAIHCPASAESEAIDLICQGIDIPDVADAILRFIVERISAMCTTIPLEPEIVVAGGLAKSRALIKHLSLLLKHDLNVLSTPEYVGAIGAVISCGSEK